LQEKSGHTTTRRRETKKKRTRTYSGITKLKRIDNSPIYWYQWKTSPTLRSLFTRKLFNSGKRRWGKNNHWTPKLHITKLDGSSSC